MPGPWEKYANQTATPAAVPAAAPAPPGVIYGAPKQPDPPTPFQQEDQSIQREKNTRDTLEWNATHNPDGTKKPDMTSGGTVDERKIATLLTRIAGGANDIQAVTQNDPGAAAPGMVEALRGDLMPGGVGGMIARGTAGADRRTVHDAQRDVLDALLTLGTGAAYNAEQLSGQMASYFPQYGDTEAEAAAKAQRLQRLIEAAKVNAGPAWAQVEPAIAQFMQASTDKGGEQSKQPWTMADSIKEWGGEYYDENGSPLGPDGGFSYDKDGNFLGLTGQSIATEPAKPESFTQGFGEGAAHTGMNAGALMGWINPVTALAEGVNMATGANIPTPQRIAAEGQQGLDLVSRNSPYQGSGAGRFVGSLVASLPTMAVPNPMMGGALGGALMAEDPNSAVDVGTNALIGAGFGKAGEFAGNKLFGRETGKVLNPEQQTVLDASTNLEAQTGVKVPVRQPDIRPELRGKAGVVEKTESGGPIIRDALAEDNAAMESALGKIGGDRAAPDRIGAGSMAQDALDRTAKSTSERGGTLYRRAERLAGNVEVRPSNAVAEIDSQIADLIEKGERSNSGLISYLNDLKADLTRGGPVSTGVLDANGKMVTRPPKGLSIDTVRSLRTDARGQINARNLGLTDAERRVSMVVAAANKDIEAALANNPKALGAFQNADRFWQEKKAFEKQISDRLLGPNNNRYGPEKTAAALESMMKPGGDFQRFQRWHATLTPEEKLDWAASTVENLGRNSKGEFSPAIFLNNIGPKGILSPKAARLVLGEDGVKSLENVKILAGAKVAAQSERNSSGTSGAVNRVGSGLRTMFLSLLGLASGDATGMIVGGGVGHVWEKLGSKRAARMLMNPDFTKWMRTLPESSSPEVINGAFKRLELVAERSPVLAADVLVLQNTLRDAFSQSPMKLAAEPPVGQQENNGGRIPPQ